MNTVEVTRVFGILTDTALKGLVLIAIAAIASYLLRKRSAASRHAVWTAAVIGHLALPVFGAVVPDWRIPLVATPKWAEVPVATPTPEADPVRGAGVAATVSTDPGELEGESNAVQIATAPAELGEAAGESKWPLTVVLGMLWLAGAVLVLLRLAVGTWKVGRLAKTGDRVDDGEWLSLTQRIANRLGITRPLTLLRGDRLAIPVTWGVVYPAVLLPPDASEWTEERRRFVLVHEMAHVKRFDALTQLVTQVTIALLWFDPFLWYAAHRMRVEREHACDDYVLREGTTPSLYAGELLEMVQSIGNSSRDHAAPAFAALAMARRSEFEGRMLAILDKRHDRSTLGRGSAIAASIGLVILALPLAALKPFASAAAINPRVFITAPESAPRPSINRLSEIACDSVMKIPVTQSNRTLWTHNHVLTDDSDRRTILEHLSYRPGRCVQAIIEGDATIEGDRLVSLPAGSHAYFREVSDVENRMLRIEPDKTGRFAYSGAVQGSSAAFDDEMQAWVNRTLETALRETAIDARERVARWVTQGGVDRALLQIGRINSVSSRKTHYQALDALGIRAPKADRSELNRVLGESENSGDSASALRQYGSSDDPAMILMALQGAAELSSDEDRRVLLTTIAPKALGKKDATLRKAFFDASTQFTSDSDLRVLYTSILSQAQSDPQITLAILTGVQKQMTSDEDKRVTLTGVISQKLLKTDSIRRAFMTSARSIESDSDFAAVMQAALR